ncbi:DUF6932 family protein [Lysinimonas soli]|uniref:DUF6932 family protein n=1 Tax=Lysinimonas soli TaxID=1074233 RepID=A0ABW0NNA8_9MICO
MDDRIFSMDGWLVPGRHEVEMDDIFEEFAPASDNRRVEIWKALEILRSVCNEYFEGGVLLLAGSFVSRAAGPVFLPTIAIVPENQSDLTNWSDAMEERFMGFLSLHDIIVGALGPTYVPVLHPLSGCIEVLYCEPQDADQLVLWMGTVTMSSGEDIVGARGVLEVAW